MLEKLKENAAKAKEDRRRRKAEKEKVRLQQEIESARREEKRLAEEKAVIEAEKARLLTLSDKEIMVEMIFAIRGFYSRFLELEEEQSFITKRIDDMEDRISDVESDIENLRSSSSGSE